MPVSGKGLFGWGVCKAGHAAPALLQFFVPCVLPRGPAVVRGEAGALFHWHEKEHHEQKEEAKAQAQAQDAAASGADSKKES